MDRRKRRWTRVAPRWDRWMEVLSGAARAIAAVFGRTISPAFHPIPVEEVRDGARLALRYDAARRQSAGRDLIYR
ncbi:hypothetical protein [Thermoflexus sp.]|uniref:hypothetical protein n=1 Tax=Thermoflexus sp. TaxID=1969742 RepID=UPI0025D67582|nr:hypothetical protein [Thermoflexus sp.]MDW8180855.1 hypothetical protein [Anaerolineae bacterium]MCS6964749.1 hypothetical protein [Thermoflexus sp.]MCS7351399.1 hypothetical protein [Thermoflexus sp.]MCX7689299.1 hypothetical protein [Thermoflexus sp.]MDW8184076.1 hypothetical protein [Anaerolineae bacterium]